MGGHKYYLMKFVFYHCKVDDADCIYESNELVRCSDCESYKRYKSQVETKKRNE